MMRSFAVIICFFCLSCIHFNNREYSENSGFDRTQIDSITLENLEVLGRVWGYVKYHHPIFADSTINIDYELFELLPKVADADRITRNRVLTEWIDGLGEFTVNRERYDTLPPDHIGRQKIDLNWTQDTARLGAALSNRLTRLRYADRCGNCYATKTLYNAAYYQKHFKGVDMGFTQEWESPNVGFEHEKGYAEIIDPDYGYRLLAVFRFWNMVEYFFPSKYLIDRSWGEVLPEYISRMASMPDGDYEHTIWRMIAEIKDSHATVGNCISKIFGVNRAPLTTIFAENRLFIATPDTIDFSTQRIAPFQVGDEILTVSDLPVEYYLKQARTYIPCSNEERIYEETAEIILRAKLQNTALRIRYRRKNVERDTLIYVNSPYYQKRLYSSCKSRILDNSNIFYLNPFNYSEKDEAQYAQMLSKTDGIIIDLRNGYPEQFGNFIHKYILPDSIRTTSLYTYPVLSLPGTFATDGKLHPKRKPYHGAIMGVLLAGNRVQSSGETWTQVLQSRQDFVTAGNRTAGANGNASFIDLPGGIKTNFSGLGWYYNDGEEVQRQGVRIDYEVHPTVEGIKAGRDEVLEKAVQILKTRGPRKSLKE